MDQIYVFFENIDWTQVAFALAILIVGIIVAYVLRGLIGGVINRTGLGKRAQTTGGNIGNAIGKAVFWLVILYTFYLALSRLNMGSYLGPIDDLFSTIGNFVPKLLAAGFTFFIGYIVAKVAKNATTATLEAIQIDNLVARTGVTEATGSRGSLAKALGTLVFVIVIVPVAIAALSILEIEEVSVPLSNMLNGFVGFIPELVAAALVLAVSIFIGRFVSNFLQNFLPSLGFDRSVNEVMMLDDGEGLRTSPSKAAGYLAFLIILVIGVSAAVSILGNDSLSRAFDSVQTFGGQLLEAAVLIVIGVFLANLVGRFMSSVINPRIAAFVKYAFMVLFIFLGLAQLDPAGNIIPVAFSAFVISAAVAAALAFGLGGRDWASKVLDKSVPPSTIKKLGDTPVVKKTTAKKPVVRRAPPPKT